MRKLVLAVTVVWTLSFGFAQAADDKATQELRPRPVTMKGEYTVGEAIAQLAIQSGNPVIDRRRRSSDKKIELDLSKSTFWPALEQIARAAGCGFSVYDGEGAGVALIDRPLRSTAVDHQGIVRFAPRNVSVMRDEETGTHQCLVDLGVTWEPRCQPLHMDVGPITATFAADKQGKTQQIKQEVRGLTPVLGKPAGDIKVFMPAPNRPVAAIATLEGEVTLIAPSKTLRFAFTGLKENQPASQTQEEVKVSLTRVKTTVDRWTVDVLIDNPKDGPDFESFRKADWLFYNTIALENKDGKTTWLNDPAEVEELTATTSYQAHLRYHFTKNGGSAPKKEDLENWRLVYLTPGRIVQLRVPFMLKNIELP